ncbi:Ribose import permease protein RbsC [subsurface metagenome]
MSGGRAVSAINARNIMLQSATRGVAAIGQAFVILTAGIDLSVGGVALICCVVGTSLMTGTTGFPVGPVAIMLLLGIAMGAVNGFLVSRIGLPALIATLAMWQILDGAAFRVTKGMIIIGLPRVFTIVGQGYVGPMPVAALIFIAVAVVAFIVLHYTSFGRSVYAVGGNAVSSWLSGINVKNTIFIVYVISGFCGALAGIILSSRLMVGSLVVGAGLELDSIAAVCIGGVSLFGGRGTLVGVILGVFIISVINNGMNLMALHSSYQSVVKGAIIISAVATDQLRRRR